VISVSDGLVAAARLPGRWRAPVCAFFSCVDVEIFALRDV
jgi:hypothetical protein